MPDAPADAIYVATYVEVAAAHAREAATLLARYCDSSRRAEGNLRAEAAQEIGRPDRFIVLEIWKDQAAFDAHGPAATDLRDKLKPIENAPPDPRIHSGMAIGDSSAPAKDAVCVATHVDVPPPRKDELIAALGPLAEASRKGDGNLRFEVWQQASRPNHFTVVETWKDRTAYDARGSAHAQRTFRDTLGPMLGALYDERLFTMVG